MKKQPQLVGWQMRRLLVLSDKLMKALSDKLTKAPSSHHCREDLLGVLCVADDFECQLINVEGFERNVLDADAALHVRQAQHLK